jgi:hypothetical protein
MVLLISTIDLKKAHLREGFFLFFGQQPLTSVPFDLEKNRVWENLPNLLF